MTSSVLVCALAGLLPLNVFGQSLARQDVIQQAAAFEQAGHYAEAAAALRAAIHSLERTSPEYPLLPNLWNALASAHIGMGAYLDAEEDYRCALSLVEKAQGKENANYALLLANLADVYAVEGRTSVAVVRLQEAAKFDPTGKVSLTLANLLIGSGRFAEAEETLSRIRQSEDLPVVLNDLGVIRMRRGQLSEAAELIERSVGALEATAGPDHAVLLRPLLNLAETYAALNRKGNAEITFRRAMAIAESRYGPEHPSYGYAAHGYAAFLRKLGRKGEAGVLEAKAKAASRAAALNNGFGLTIAANH